MADLWALSRRGGVDGVEQDRQQHERHGFAEVKRPRRSGQDSLGSRRAASM
jgi:hypothetical protein